MTTNTITKVGFSINAQQLKEIKAAIKGLKHNKKFPFLENVRFTISEDQLVFEAQDLNNYVKIELEAENATTGQLAMSKKVLKDLKLKKNEIATFETDNNTNFKITLNGLTVTHFQFEFLNGLKVNFDNDYTFTVSENYLSSLKNAIKYTSQMETRPILQGVAHREGALISTDSHQMYYNENLHSLENGNMTVHHLTAKVVTDLFKSDELTFKVSNCENYVRYNSGHITVIAKLIDGRHPATKNMFPQSFNTEVKLNENEINTMIDTFKGMLAQIESKNNTIKFIVNDNVLTVKGMDVKETIVNEQKFTEHVEKASIIFDDIVTSGHDLEVTFNGKNLLNALEQQKGNNITIQFTGKLSPFQITTDTNEKYLYSPVRTY